MGVIQKQRERVAQVIGVKLANELADDQLPAILNAIDGNEESVRIAAQAASRDDVRNPVGMLLYKIRERSHTGTLPVPPGGSRVTYLPPPPTPGEVDLRKQKMRDWTKIMHWSSKHREMGELWRAYCRAFANPTPEQAEEIRTEMLQAISEVEEAHVLRQDHAPKDEPEGPAAC